MEEAAEDRRLQVREEGGDQEPLLLLPQVKMLYFLFFSPQDKLFIPVSTSRLIRLFMVAGSVFFYLRKIEAWGFRNRFS